MAMTQQERAANYAAYSALTPEQKKARIQAATGAIPQTSTNNNVSSTANGMSAQTTPTATTTGSIPNNAITRSPVSGLSASQKSAQDWISNPTSGFGGIDQYTTTQQQRYNQALSSGDQDLLNRLNADAQRVGYSFQTPQSPANITPSGGYMPQGDAVTNVRSSSDLNQLATDQTALDRAALLRSITDRIGNIKNSAQYANQLISDNRTLEDAQLGRALNPFSGRTGYVQSQVARGRSIDDTSRAATLENQLNTIKQELTDFDKLTPERQRQINNELLQLERQFGLNVGQLTGYFNGDRTLEGLNSDRNYGLNYAGQFGTLPGNSQGASGSSASAPTTLEAQNQAFNQDMATQQFDFQKTQQEWENLFNQNQFDESKAARLWEQAFKDKSFTQDVKEAAASRGLQWASLSQRDKEFVADQAFREKQFEYQKKMDAIEEQPDMNAYISNINKLYIGTDPNTEMPTVTNPSALRDYVISLRLPDEKTDQLLLYYGLPTN